MNVAEAIGKQLTDSNGDMPNHGRETVKKRNLTSRETVKNANNMQRSILKTQGGFYYGKD